MYCTTILPHATSLLSIATVAPPPKRYMESLPMAALFITRTIRQPEPPITMRQRTLRAMSTWVSNQTQISVKASVNRRAEATSMATQMLFLSKAEQQDQIIYEAWKNATELGVKDINGLLLNTKYYTLLSGVWWQVQSHFKSEAKLIVESTYRYKVLTLGKMPYTCEELENLKGHWYSSTAFNLIHCVWFATPCLNGFQYSDYFYLFLLSLIVHMQQSSVQLMNG
ncbi:hypothetical protein FRB95_002959 [Tulasnella sp. JGI-2019a]|nr:hypothetical protein FRB95_002959 [Tulasnella sp. JGI-2019a]